MKNALAVLFFFIAASSFALDIPTSDGKLLRDCEIKAVEKEGLRVSHKDGTGFLDFDTLFPMSFWKTFFGHNKPSPTTNPTHQTTETSNMSDLITPENITKEMLKSIFDCAYMETSLDSEGDIMVREGVNCYVTINEKKDVITLQTFFGFASTAPQQQRLECVNAINTKFIMVRATSEGTDTLTFDYLGIDMTPPAATACGVRWC